MTDALSETSAHRDATVALRASAARVTLRSGDNARSRWALYRAEPAESSRDFVESVVDAWVTSASAASHSIDDLSVAHVNRAISNRGCLGIVRNHQHRLPEFLV